MTLFPEMKLEVDEEPEEDEGDMFNTPGVGAALLEEDQEGEDDIISTVEANAPPEVACFAEFSARVARAPGQVRLFKRLREEKLCHTQALVIKAGFELSIAFT